MTGQFSFLEFTFNSKFNVMWGVANSIQSHFIHMNKNIKIVHV